VRNAHCNILYDGCNGFLPRSFGALHLRCISRARNPRPSLTAALSSHQRHAAGCIYALLSTASSHIQPADMGALGRGGCRGDADSERCLSGRWDGDGDGNDTGRAILRVIDRAVPLAAENFY
jgi:hypothetical protein